MYTDSVRTLLQRFQTRKPGPDLNDRKGGKRSITSLLVSLFYIEEFQAALPDLGLLLACSCFFLLHMLTVK